MTTAVNFNGLSVLTLESRRSVEQATLIAKFGGRPVVAPSMREVPLDAQPDAIAFLDALRAGGFDAVVLLTGGGTRALLALATTRGMRDACLEALGRTRIIARGPKPVAALREIGVAPWLVAPEPNTWHEVVAALDARASEFPLEGADIAVQEYGVSNVDLLRALAERGARVTAVPIYQWALPDDLEPLRAAIQAATRGEIDVVVLTSSVQLAHLWQVAVDMQQERALRDAFATMAIASIGPTTSEEIRRRGLEPDLEASHPKMGMLITEAAARAGEILAAKRRMGRRSP